MNPLHSFHFRMRRLMSKAIGLAAIVILLLAAWMLVHGSRDGGSADSTPNRAAQSTAAPSSAGGPTPAPGAGPASPKPTASTPTAAAKPSAAGPKPDVACGGTVTWSLDDPTAVGVPASASRDVAATWAALAPVAHLHVSQTRGDNATVVYHWTDWGIGEDDPSGISRDGSTATVTIGEDDQHLPAARLRALLLTDALKLMGVTDPTSIGSLSPHDRAAVVAQCRAQAAGPSPTVNSTPTHGTTGTRAAEEPTASDSIASSHANASDRTGKRKGVVLAIILVALLAAWLALGRRAITVPTAGIARVRKALHRKAPKPDEEVPE